MIGMPDQKELKSLIKRRHPEYENLQDHWSFLESCYLGGRKWFNDNIFQYVKEGSTEFSQRIIRAYRFNHTREIVDLVTKYIQRGKVNRNHDDASAAIKDFWEKTTQDGLDIDEFKRLVCTQSSIFGRPWIIVDKTAGEGGAGSAAGVMSKADAEQSECYAYIVSPQDVLDWSYDEQGHLRWILIQEWTRNDEDPMTAGGELQPQYRLWTKTSWSLYKNKVGKNGDRLQTVYEDASGDHDLGVVPAIPAHNMISNDAWSTPALIADIAYLDRAIANYLSNLDVIIQDQTFSQLAMPAQGLLPGEDDYKKMLEMGTKRVFLYDGEAGAAPMYLSPDVRQAHLLLDVIQQIINEIYHSVGLAGERTKQDNSKGIDNSSGVAKQNDFERVNALLISKADALEWIENQMVSLVSKWQGEDAPEQDLVSYPDNFDATGLFDEFDIATKLSLIDAPSTMRSEQMKRVVKKLFPEIGKDLLEKLRSEVDKWGKELEQGQVVLSDKSVDAQSKLREEALRDRQEAGQKRSDTDARRLDQTQQGQAK
jgi:hypothetical protein